VLGLSEAQLKRMATCFKLQRKDGTIFRLTSHDKKLTLEGEEYSPMGGVDASAKRKQGGLGEHDVELRGVISSNVITSSDLRAGRYRDAKITEKLCDWRYPFAGTWGSAIYWIGDVKFNGEVWECAIAGMARWLKHRVGSVFARNCEVTLGDAKCQVNLASFTVSGVGILGLVDGEKRRIIRANPAQLSGSFVDHWFRHGKVTFTSGANNGLKGDIAAYTQATREIELQLPMPFEIGLSDQFSIVAGCDKRSSTCILTFNNIVNFRGDPFLPGSDKVLRITPQ
jgi:uncharacterized phage protein (TIGR02218 family)